MFIHNVTDQPVTNSLTTSDNKYVKTLPVEYCQAIADCREHDQKQKT